MNTIVETMNMCIICICRKFNIFKTFLMYRLGSRRQRQDHSPKSLPQHSNDCLRHGNSSDVRAVRAVCLLMGGAAASSALGYLSSCPGSSNVAAQAPEITHSVDFSELGSGTSYHHSCAETVDSPHFNSFDFEGDSDFDAFDCGGFTF